MISVDLLIRSVLNSTPFHLSTTPWFRHCNMLKLSNLTSYVVQVFLSVTKIVNTNQSFSLSTNRSIYQSINRSLHQMFIYDVPMASDLFDCGEQNQNSIKSSWNMHLTISEECCMMHKPSLNQSIIQLRSRSAGYLQCVGINCLCIYIYIYLIFVHVCRKRFIPN